MLGMKWWAWVFVALLTGINILRSLIVFGVESFAGAILGSLLVAIIVTRVGVAIGRGVRRALTRVVETARSDG